jgi:uncharacterized RDD family membrane protein YckC
MSYSASLPKRFLAVFIDLFLIFCTSLALTAKSGGFSLAANYSSGTWTFTDINGLQFISIFLAYYLLTGVVFKRSIGKAALKLKLVTLKGDAPQLPQILIREILKPIDFFLIGIPLLLLTNNNRTLGDIASGLHVVPVKPQDKVPSQSKWWKKIIGALLGFMMLWLWSGIVMYYPKIQTVNGVAQQDWVMIQEVAETGSFQKLNDRKSQEFKEQVEEEQVLEAFDKIKIALSRKDAQGKKEFQANTWTFKDNFAVVSGSAYNNIAVRIIYSYENNQWKIQNLSVFLNK